MHNTKFRIIAVSLVLAFSVTLLWGISRISYDGGNVRMSMSAGQIQQDGKNKYKEVSYPTPNVDADAVNDVEGVILHHTAEPTVKRSLEILSSPVKKVSTHVVIDNDGTRYIMAKPEKVTFHAGLSILNGREKCNYFTIGIEFQGNTLEEPLTQDQIESGVEFLIPVIKKYNIPVSNIVTHEMVRKAYKARYPNKRCFDKVDITPTEYNRFMKALKKKMYNQ